MDLYKFSELDSGVQVAFISLLVAIVALVIAIFTAIVSTITMSYQKKTYRNTTYLIRPYNALFVYLKHILEKMFFLERFLYAYSRVLKENDYRIKVSNVYFYDLKIDLSLFNSNIFLSSHKSFSFVIFLKENLNNLNVLIDYFTSFNRDQNSEINEKEIIRHIEAFEHDLRYIFISWVNLMYLGDSFTEGDLVENSKKRSRHLPYMFESSIKQIAGNFVVGCDKEKLAKEAERIMKDYSYNYNTFFSSVHMKNYTNDIIVNFYNYYCRMKEDSIKL